MRLAFWRAGKDKVVAARVAPKPAPVADKPATAAAVSETGDLDLHALGHALMRKRGWIIIPTVLAAVLSVTAVNLITPIQVRSPHPDRRTRKRLRAADRRPHRGAQLARRRSGDQSGAIAVVAGSRARDHQEEQARRAAGIRSGAAGPVAAEVAAGVVRDRPRSVFPDAGRARARCLYERFTAYAVDKSRVIVVEFQSRDPDIAARVANSIAEGYLVLQQGARQEQAKSAGLWLSGEIDSLRKKVAEAESRVEDFRSKSSLFVGTNNTSLSNQQMGELNTQLNNARALKSDAESRARLIREMLQSGKPIEASEVLNSELTRRLSEQRVTLRAQLAEQSSTLLDAHPRIKELKAQLADLDRQLREEAGKISRSLDSDARIAGGRVEGLIASLDQSKKQASSTNGQDVQLRALEREAKAQRDLLESYLAKYREANARENIDSGPADGRIISRATISNTPAYPKKLPIVLIATLATLMLSAGAITTGELLRMTAPRAVAALVSAPAWVRAPAAVAATAVAAAPVAAADPEPVFTETRAEIATERTEIERLADDLRGAGTAARKVTILGTAPGDSITLTALTLARLMARDARVVVVDLAGTSLAVSAVSADPTAPGLAELMLGEASFSQIITRDRLSRAHLVTSGRPGADRALLQSPRLTLALDALLRVYDHVLLDAGAASDLPAELLTAQARAVVVPDPSMAADARTLMCEQLAAVGFTEVTMLSKPSQPSNAIEPGLRVVAA